MNNIEYIEKFIAKHHLLTLATCNKDAVYCSSAFYVYDADLQSFIIASDTHTTHIQNALQNDKVAANIHLETKEIGKIEGLQIEGTLHRCDSASSKKLYFKRFPYAKALAPTLWELKVRRFKLTDNKLGFGKKIVLDLM